MGTRWAEEAGGEARGYTEGETVTLARGVGMERERERAEVLASEHRTRGEKGRGTSRHGVPADVHERLRLSDDHLGERRTSTCIHHPQHACNDAWILWTDRIKLRTLLQTRCGLPRGRFIRVSPLVPAVLLVPHRPAGHLPLADKGFVLRGGEGDALRGSQGIHGHEADLRWTRR